MNPVDWAKDNPIKTGAIVIIGGFVFLSIYGKGGGVKSPAVVYAGPSESQIAAATAVDMARLQSQTQIAGINAALEATQIGAGTQLQSDQLQAQVAMRNIDALREIGLAETGAQKEVLNRQLDMAASKERNFYASLSKLKKKDRDEAIQAYVTGQPVQKQSNPGNSIGGILSGIGSAASAILPFFSDERLKENIQHVGYDAKGRDVYEFNYRGSSTRRRGYMAQALLRSEPEKVTVSKGGYLSVN